MANKILLVCDLDNTLYDWVGYFVPAFYEMVRVSVEIIGCNRETLLDDLRKVHQEHHDSEQPFALLETDTVKNHFSGLGIKEIAKVLDPAFHAFNSARKRHLQLHDGVRDTLDALRRSGVALVAHTESRLYGAIDRLNRFDLMNYFQRVYCRERSITVYQAAGNHERWMSSIASQKIRELSHHQSKPNPDVLLEICAAEGARYDQTAYVGDSIARDMLMAKRAGVFSIWAAYGANHEPAMYAALVRISHWTTDEVELEQKLKQEAKSIKPDYVASQSFRQVAAALDLRN